MGLGYKVIHSSPSMVKGAASRKTVVIAETTKKKMAAAALTNFQRKLEGEAQEHGLPLCQYLTLPKIIRRLARNKRRVRNQKIRLKYLLKSCML